jgi:PAS domain S-box-containing protein
MTNTKVSWTMVRSLTHPVGVSVSRGMSTIRREKCTMSEQTQIGEQLDQRVAERTRELAEANEALKQQLVVERQRTAAARRASERDARSILASIPGLVASLTPTGDVDFVNDPLIEYCGRTLEELQHWGTSDTVHRDDLPRVVQLFSQGIASGEPYDFEARLRRFDGAYRWFQVRGLPLRDARGAILRWYTLLTDIDERRRAEDALRHSEANLRAIVETTPECVHVIARDGTLLSVNAAGAEMAGAPSVDLMRGRNFYNFVTPDDRERYRAFNERVCAGQKGFLEFDIVRMDGERRHLETRAAPLRNDDGTVAQLGIARDITARKQAEARLRESERHLRQLTETIPVMLWSATPDGAIDYCNDRFLEYTGFDAEQVMGRGAFTKVLHPDDLDRTVQEWLSCIRAGAAFQVEVRKFHAADATYRWCLVNARPLLDEHRRILKWYGTVVDMHDWRQAQEELRHTQEKLAYMMRVTTMGELTASIAHEVNQPLSGIMTNAGTCLRMLAADPPDVAGACETARRTIRDAHRASDVIARLRALFTGKELTTESMDLNDATREVIALSMSDLQRHRVMLRTELADDLPFITANRVQLQQVILNLLRNASDAMAGVDDGRRQLLIRTERDDGDRVRLTVQDVGVGLEAHVMDKLFQAFYTTKTSGMGIGLSVSRSIIEKHGGRLWAEPNDGPGATFAFSIPRVPEHTTDAALAMRNS